MDIVWRIVTNTPIWVFALMALLVWLGSQSLRTRQTPLRRMLIVPIVFLLMGVSRLLFAGGQPMLVGAWVVAAGAFAAVAFYVGPGAMTVESDGTIRRPGSVIPLIRNLAVFLLQYAVAVIAAMKLDSSGTMPLVAQAVSGACAGYFLGWGIGMIRSYRAQMRTVAA
jgi:hypothetical protein